MVVKPVGRRRFPRRSGGLTPREGLNPIGSIDPGWTGGGDDAERLNLVQSQRGRDRGDVLREGQEPPDADPDVRWCGSRGE